MWKNTLLLVCLSGCCFAGPLHGVKRNVPIVVREEEAEAERPAPEPLAPEYPEMPSTLTLPSNATSIRTDITDNFSCDDRVYGYYADVENDCQIFHVCLPVTYADGKENTFRWSFICPEETVFSQDSFTCMRREDMAITCEESVNYYELNRNFGMSEEQNGNSNNVPPSEEQAEAQQAEPAEPAQQEVQQPAASPQEQTQAAAVSAPQLSKPMKEKPVKVQKPNRRKPQPKPQQDQTIHPTNKLPSIIPLRKMPNAGPKVSVSIPAEVASVHEVKDEVKPVPPRYKKRPAVTYNSEKEAVEVPAQPFKVEVVHTVSNPESFKRKRPTFAHKTNAVPVVETAHEAGIVEPVKFEFNLPAKDETVTISEPVAQAAEETPVVVEPVQTAVDAEAQASETDTTQQIMPANEAEQSKDPVGGPIKVAEPVGAEEGGNTAPVVEETIKIEEPVVPPAEEISKIDEPVVAEVAPVVEAQKVEEAATPLETVEEIPAVVSESFDSAPEKEKLEEVANSQIDVEAPAQPEQPAEPADQLAGASESVALDAAPAVIAPLENAEESLPALPSLEELEEQKPADAIETMPATPEMEQQDPTVQEAFEKTDSHMQTVGGFKPVDPELAAEAEALISDFINTLKSGHSNATPNLPMPVEEGAPATSAERENAKVEIEESQQAADNNEEAESRPEEAQAAPEADTSSLKTTAEEHLAVAAENTPVVAETEPIAQEEVKVSPLLNFLISNSFPADMYQIPVTVIQMPNEEAQNVQSDVQESQPSNVEEVKAEEAQAEQETPAKEENREEVKYLPKETAATQTEAEITEEQKVEDAPAVEAQLETEPAVVESVKSQTGVEQPAAPAAFRPISIDDIVELVKERLDQAPADEKGAPMELVMQPGNSDKPVELKLSLEKGSAPQAESADETPAENIIFPIYHRVSEADSSDAKAQEAVAVNEPSAVMTDPELPLEAEAIQNVAKTSLNTETETKSASAVDMNELENSAATEAVAAETPVEIDTADVAKANRALRSRSLTKANLDPRKRRFLFRSDAS